MLPNFARNIFYKLHDSCGFPRKIADGLSWGFMTSVRIAGIRPPMDLTPLTLISHRYKFIYIGIPKTATRSFRTYFLVDNPESYDIESYESKAGFQKALASYPDYYKFSFVRNPWERALSCYNSKIGHEDLSLLKRARIISFYKNLEPGMSFKAFASWLNTPEGQDEYADRHWMSQHKFLYCEDGAPVCNFVGRYETLQDDLQSVIQEIAMPVFELPRAGWISKKNKHHDSYDEESKALIAQRYARDIELFGYEF